MASTRETKLEKLGEIFHMLEGHHQHNYAEMVQRIYSALSLGTQIPLQDTEDLQTITRYGLIQAREALRQIQQSIAQAEELSQIVDDIKSDAHVQAAMTEANSLLDNG